MRLSKRFTFLLKLIFSLTNKLSQVKCYPNTEHEYSWSASPAAGSRLKLILSAHTDYSLYSECATLFPF